METISSFRGMSGEVVRGFVKLSLFFTIIPIILVWIVFIIYMAFLGHRVPGALNLVIIYGITAMFLGRFSLAAARGELNAAFFSTKLERGEVFRYVGRFFLITLMWGIPVLFLIWLISGNLGAVMSGLIPGVSLSGSGYGMAPSLSFADRFAFGFILLMLVLLIGLVLLAITPILAAYCESVTEVFSLETWGWVFRERGEDLTTYLGGIASAYVMFFLIYSIPFMIITYIAFKISINFGTFISMFFTLLPYFIAPVILGRMAGAFICGETHIEIDLDISAREMASEMFTDPAVASAIAAQIAEKNNNAKSKGTNKYSSPITKEETPKQSKYKPSSEEDKEENKEVIQKTPTFHEIIDKVRITNESDLAANLIKAEHHLTQSPADLYKTIEVAFLRKKAGKEVEAVDAAGKAITLAISLQLPDFALDVYKGFIKNRSQLVLEHTTLNALVDLFLEKDQYLDAGWCSYFVTVGTDDENLILNGQKKLLAIADKAKRSNNSQDAISLYEFFIKKFPESTLIDYAEQSAAEEKRKLGK